MSADADILEQTLRASDDPVELAALADAPLPEGVGHLLSLLTGQSARVHSAAERLEVAPETLLVAVRRYVLEVMLHPAADDARMLGLTPHSGPDDLKRNYRALQSWLHPDRTDGPEDASALSARINAAWSRLRAARRAQSSSGTLVAFRPRWQKVEVPAKRRPRRWIAAASVAPILLALTVALTMDLRPPDTSNAPRPVKASPSGDNPVISAPATALSPGRGDEAYKPSLPPPVRQRHAPLDPFHDTPLTQAPQRAAPVALPSPEPASSQAARVDVQQSAARAQQQAAAHDGTADAATLDPATRKTPSSGTATAESALGRATATATAPTPAAIASTGRPARPQKPRTARPDQHQVIDPPRPAAAAASVRSGSPTRPPQPEAAISARPESGSEASSAPALPQGGETSLSPTSQPIAVQRETEALPSAPPTASAEVPPSAAAGHADADAAARAAPSEPPDSDAIDALPHVDRARAQGASLLDYLTRRRESAPPIWHSGSALAQAETARRILTSGRQTQPARPLRDLERWHFEAHRAEGRIPVEPADRRLNTQVVLVQMLWKNDDWWVEQIALETAQ